MNESDYTSSTTPAEDLGGALKKERLSKKMTIGDVASHLRLRDSVIDAVETGDYPEATRAYVKGYIRAYAKLLDLDEQWVNESIDQLAIEAPVAESPVQISVKPYWWQQLPMNTKMVASLFVAIVFCLLLARIIQSPIDEQAEIRDLVAINQSEVDTNSFDLDSEADADEVKITAEANMDEPTESE